MNNTRRPDKVRIDWEDLEKIKGKHNIYTGGLLYNYQGKPFTGFRIDCYHDNGQMAGEQEYVDGEDIGWSISFHDNGVAERETLNYGATTVYHAKYDRDGNKISSYFFAAELLDELCAITGQDPNDVDR